jgi:predicted amino acid-binding ACT domain protein
MEGKIVITVIGDDKVGIVSEVSLKQYLKMKFLL